MVIFCCKDVGMHVVKLIHSTIPYLAHTIVVEYNVVINVIWLIELL